VSSAEVIAARSQLEVRVGLWTGRLLVGGDDVECAMTLVERGLGHERAHRRLAARPVKDVTALGARVNQAVRHHREGSVRQRLPPPANTEGGGVLGKAEAGAAVRDGGDIAELGTSGAAESSPART
jgi:hypothetical protein